MKISLLPFAFLVSSVHARTVGVKDAKEQQLGLLRGGAKTVKLQLEQQQQQPGKNHNRNVFDPTQTNSHSKVRKLPEATVELTDGVALQNRSGRANHVKLFVLRQVADGMYVNCTLRGNDGGINQDADLYVRMSMAPDVIYGLYDSASMSGTTQESATVGPMNGNTDVYAAVYGFTDYNGLMIQCKSIAQNNTDSNENNNGVGSSGSSNSNSWSSPYSYINSNPIALTSNVTLTGLSGGINTLTKYVVRRVPLGSYVTCTLNGTNNDPSVYRDADLYLRKGAAPDFGSWMFDCTSTSSTLQEYCSVGPTTTANTQVFIAVLGFTAYSDTKINCTITSVAPVPNPYADSSYYGGGYSSSYTYTSTDPVVLADHVAVEGQSGVERSLTLYALQDVQPGLFVVCTLNGTSDGDADLYLRANAVPDLNSYTYNCSSTSGTNNEFCQMQINATTPTTVYATIMGYSAYENVTIECWSSVEEVQSPYDDSGEYYSGFNYTSTVPIVLTDGIALEGQSGSSNSPILYVLQDFQSGPYVICTLNGTDYATLYMRVGAAPDLFSWNFDYVCDTGYPCQVDLNNTNATTTNATSVFAAILSHGIPYNNVTIECQSSTEPVYPDDVFYGYNYTYSSTNPVVLSDGIALEEQSGSTFAPTLYVLQDVQRGPYVVCAVNSTNVTAAYADIYVRIGTPPDLNNMVQDCISVMGSICQVKMSNSTNVGTAVYVAILSYNDYDDYTIQCKSSTNAVVQDYNSYLSNYTYTYSPSVTELSSGVARRGLSGPVNHVTRYAVRGVPTGMYVICNTYASFGLLTPNDIDVYMRRGSEPDLVNWLVDSSSASVGGNESCAVGPTEGDSTDVFIDIVGSSAYYNVTIQCNTSSEAPDYSSNGYTSGVVIDLSNGVAWQGNLDTNYSATAFVLSDVADDTDVTCTLKGTDAGLMVRVGAPMNFMDWAYDCDTYATASGMSSSPDSNSTIDGVCLVSTPPTTTSSTTTPTTKNVYVYVWPYGTDYDATLICSTSTANNAT